MNSITIKKTVKSFGTVKALEDINIEINPGELFGLIGPDGAGKTTLFRIITTLLIPDSGSVSVCGFDTVKEYRYIRNRVGYMPGRFSLYQDLTIEENLEFFASIFKTTISENYHLIEDIYKQIEPFKKRKAGQLSGGMKQKLALSCALIHKPKILVLDEPTTGVDAVSRSEFWEMLKKLKEQNITIVVSTPYMDEAILCERVALIQKGRILATKPPAEIATSFGKPLYEVEGENKYALITALRSYKYAATVYPFGQTIHYTDTRGEADILSLEHYLQSKNIIFSGIHRANPTIEDTFMALMEKSSTSKEAENG